MLVRNSTAVIGVKIWMQFYRFGKVFNRTIIIVIFPISNAAIEVCIEQSKFFRL